MKSRQLLGISAIVLGGLLFGFSMYAKGKVIRAEEGIEKASGFMSKNEVGSTHNKLSRDETMIRWTKIGGIVIAIAGVYFLIRSKKR
jgi:drug/metabolite transporter (DMT)-like permease